MNRSYVFWGDKSGLVPVIDIDLVRMLTSFPIDGQDVIGIRSVNGSTPHYAR